MDDSMGWPAATVAIVVILTFGVVYLANQGILHNTIGKNSADKPPSNQVLHSISCLPDSLKFKDSTVRLWCRNGDRLTFTPSDDFTEPVNPEKDSIISVATAYFRNNGVKKLIDSLEVHQP